jgi:hypothetical protein
MKISPPVPRLQHLGQARVDVAPPLTVGPTLTGLRRIIAITGGRFDGERLRGEILPLGADWQIMSADGTALLDARYVLKTDDGALVSIRNTGVRHGPAEVLAAIATGEMADPAAYYFRTTPVFEADEARYAWLNRLICIGSGARTRDQVIIDFYAVA